MEKYTIDGEEYIYNNGKWLTSNYTSVPIGLLSKLNKLLTSKEDLENKSFAELMEIADGAKKSNNNSLATKALNIALKGADAKQIHSLLPRLTSLYRLNGQPEKAIGISCEYMEKYGKTVMSSALFTSLAAAYCDIGDYRETKHYADRAYAMDNGKCSGELAGVYGRLRKELGDN